MRAGDFNRRSLTWIFDSHYVHVQSVTHQSWTSWWGDESGCNIPLSYSCDIWLERREDVWDGVGSAGGCWPTKSSRLIWQQWAETCPSNVFTNKLAGLLGVLWLGYGLSFYSCKCKVWIDSKCLIEPPATSQNEAEMKLKWNRNGTASKLEPIRFSETNIFFWSLVSLLDNFSFFFLVS